MIFLLVVVVTSITPMRKFYEKAIHHYGTGKVVGFLENYLREKSRDTALLMSNKCEEGRVALGHFLGNGRLIGSVEEAETTHVLSASENKSVLLIVNRECPDIPPSFFPRKEIFHYGAWRIFTHVGREATGV